MFLFEKGMSLSIRILRTNILSTFSGQNQGKGGSKTLQKLDLLEAEHYIINI